MCHPTPNQENEVKAMSSMIKGPQIYKNIQFWAYGSKDASTFLQSLKLGKIIGLGKVGHANGNPTTLLCAPRLIPTAHDFKHGITSSLGTQMPKKFHFKL